MKQRMVILSLQLAAAIGMNAGAELPTPDVRFCLIIWK